VAQVGADPGGGGGGGGSWHEPVGQTRQVIHQLIMATICSKSFCMDKNKFIEQMISFIFHCNPFSTQLVLNLTLASD
jgi:hypothetical protein